jgi:hypothetical protein
MRGSGIFMETLKDVSAHDLIVKPDTAEHFALVEDRATFQVSVTFARWHGSERRPAVTGAASSIRGSLGSRREYGATRGGSK